MKDIKSIDVLAIFLDKAGEFFLVFLGVVVIDSKPVFHMKQAAF